MAGLAIGKLAELAGLKPSALRYYESAGLLSAPARESGRRRYDARALARLRIIRLARDAGFTVAETRTLLSGFSQATPPATRWRALAERKLAEIDERTRQLERMRALLTGNFQCRCPTFADCESALIARERRARNRR
ncbi:MAG TPA: MerR family transcriptional regulator [Steroidobacteraceae bacterium]|jgi:MerR family redox-sensitive transcriptional activator SoxR|nr:MerR family transcriptional regulator [Steroidobacteraceae bacterium]